MKRLLLFATAVVVAIGVAAPYLQADFFRPAIARALERGLGRRVEVEHAHFNLFTGPGFTLDQVTIHEDPRAGIQGSDDRLAVGGTEDFHPPVLKIRRGWSDLPAGAADFGSLG